MLHYQNTKKDFWNSINSSAEAITCPCCGGLMSLQYSSSYHLKLTDNASTILNQQLSYYKQTLLKIEQSLKRHNSPAFDNNVKDSAYNIDLDVLSIKGMYKTNTAEALSLTIDALDIEGIDGIIRNYPLLSDKEGDNKKLTAQKLLQLIQTTHLSSGLLDVTFDQPVVENLITQRITPESLLQAMENDSGNNANDSEIDFVYLNLKKQFPTLLQYCLHISKDQSQIDPDLNRILSILIVYFGDTEGTKSSSSISKFTFGECSIFRNWSTVGKLLISYYYVSQLQSLFPKYVECIRKHENSEESTSSNPVFVIGSHNNANELKNLIDTIPEFEAVLLYTTDFACAGPAATIPDNAEFIKRQDNKKVLTNIKDELKDTIEAKACGWIPKKYSTESLLLVGGTASSKTTLLQSTIVQVKRASANLGMEFKTCSPLSNLLLEYYEQRYDDGQWDGATENGCRTSMQISLEQAENPSVVSYLVINDIAGERFEEMLRVDRNFNEIQSPLTKSNNILFLFDLIAWRALGALIKESQSSDSSDWSKIIQERTKQETVGRAKADCHDLLIKFVDRIKKTVSSENSTQLIDKTFILAIPKCDLYLGEGMFLNGWVNKLTTDGCFKKLGDDDNSPYMSTWNFSKISKGDGGIFQKALEGINVMSKRAEEAIIELSKEQQDDEIGCVSAERIAKTISSMLTYLKHTFSDVKVVPISALGGNPPSDQKEYDPNAKYSFKAVPLFCEALLLLPMIKMCTKTDGEK